MVMQSLFLTIVSSTHVKQGFQMGIEQYAPVKNTYYPNHHPKAEKK